MSLGEKTLDFWTLDFGLVLVPAAGVEPATFRSGGERSNPLSYAGMLDCQEGFAQKVASPESA
jgi:hypothetical protein